MRPMICLAGNDAKGALTALAEALRMAGWAPFTCVRPNAATLPDGIYDLVLRDPVDEMVLERMAAKAGVLVRLGLESLTERLDAGCIETLSVQQIVVLMQGEERRIHDDLAEGKTESLARLRLAERHAHIVLAGVAEQTVCLRPTHTLNGPVAGAVLAALKNPQVAATPLSKMYMCPSPLSLPTALRALSTEVLALRPDAETYFKQLRDAGHVAASTLLPEALPLPGGRHLAHYMRETALCPPTQWDTCPDPVREKLRIAVAHWVLYGQAEALNVLAPLADMHAALACATLLCCAGIKSDSLKGLHQRLMNTTEEQSDFALATFAHVFVQSCRTPDNATVQALCSAIGRLPRLGGQLVWGCTPIINNKYWSQAMREGGADSCTVMPTFYSSINTMEDYDLYFHDLSLAWADCVENSGELSAFLYMLLNAEILHMPFRGGPLSYSSLAMWEPTLLRAAGIKSVMIPYGSDAYMYSRLASPTLTHALNASYPGMAREEDSVRHNVLRWSAQASFVLGWAMTVGNGFPRWDALVVAPFHIDTRNWACKTVYTEADGQCGTVRILHCPNHRSFKGTEFIIDAVRQLKDEGLDVELILLEKVQNHVVRRTLLEVDILVDQCLAHYALNAIEGMTSGLPVCSNLEEPDLTVLRRFSYLDECPIVSVTPETLAERLRLLVRNPGLRRRLGQAGRQYAEKYHSLAAARHLFGAIHAQILSGSPGGIYNIYHPLLSDYVKQNPVPRELHKGKIRPEDSCA